MDNGRKLALGVAVTVWVLAGLAGVALFRPAHARPHLTVHEAGTVPANASAVDVDRLTASQRRVFERALASDDGTATVPSTVDADVWIANGYVTDGNTTYRVAVSAPG